MRSLVAGIILIIFVSIAGVYAEQLILEYSDGLVEIKKGDNWNELYIGDVIPNNAVIRLDKETIVEISGETESITLSKPGIYSVSNLISEKKKLSNWNIGSLLKNKIITATHARTEKKSQVMGVRGAQAGSDTDVEWAEDEVSYLSDAKVLLEQNETEKAIDLLNKGLAAADKEEADEYKFYLGLSYTRLGKNPQAIKYFREINPDPYTDYFPQFVLVSGTLYLDSLDYSKAENLFEIYLQTYPSGVHSQLVNYLSAIALYRTGKIETAKAKMKRAYAMDKTSEVGKLANRILASWE